MATAFDLPANPAVGQEATLPSGFQMRWNGTAWEFLGTTFNSDDYVKRAGDTMLGALKLADGTVAAPALAFGTEPGFGWLRAAAGRLSLAQNGAEVQRLNSDALATNQYLFPRVAGAYSQYVAYSGLPANADRNGVSVGVNAAGAAFISAINEGAASAKALSINAGAGVSANGSIAAPNFKWGPAGLGSNTYLTFSNNDPIIQFSNGYYLHWESAAGRLNYVRAGSGAPNAIFQANGDFAAGRDIFCGSANGLALINSTAGVAALRFTSDNWKFEWQNGYLTYYNTSGTQCFRMNGGDGTASSYGSFYAGTGGGIGGFIANCGSSGTAGLNVTGYVTSGSTLYQVLAQGNPNWNVASLQAIHAQGTWAGMRMYAAGAAVDFMLSSGGAWGTVKAAAFEVQSDERGKEQVKPLTQQHDAFMAIQPIEWHWPLTEPQEGDAPSYPDLRAKWGFSAQNLTQAVPLAVNGDVCAVDEEGQPITASIDPVPVIAITVLELQALIARNTALEQTVADLMDRVLVLEGAA